MKPYPVSRNPYLWLLVAALLGACILFTPGCKTSDGKPNIKAVAYHTLKDTQIAVKAAMSIYSDKCVTGKVSVEKQAQIDSAHAKYRIAWRAAVGLARSDYSKLTPDNVLALSTELLNLISQL